MLQPVQPPARRRRASTRPPQKSDFGLALGFLMQTSDADNPLSPVSPFGLAVLSREILSSVSPAWSAYTDAYTAIWNRRADLADRVSGVLEACRADRRTLNRARSAVDVAGIAWYVLAAAIAVVLVSGLGSFINGQSNHYAPTLLSGPTALATSGMIIVVGLGFTGVARLWSMWAEKRYKTAYTRLHDCLVQQIGVLVHEIIHLKDEHFSGELSDEIVKPNLAQRQLRDVVPTSGFRTVLALVSEHPTYAAAVAGPLGVGKSVLLRLLCDGEEASRRIPALVGVYLAAPASAVEREFIDIIYKETAETVLRNKAGRFVDYRWQLWPLRLRRWDWLPGRRNDEITWAWQHLKYIRFTTADTRTSGFGQSRFGLLVSFSRGRTLTERDLGYAGRVASFCEYLDGHRRRNGGPILIAIDELDKIRDRQQAIDVINRLKDLFKIDGVRFVIAVLDEVLHEFTARGIPARDAFESAFDDVIEIPRLKAKESCNLLQSYFLNLPEPVALFCHSWSAGLPSTAAAIPALTCGRARLDVQPPIGRRRAGRRLPACVRCLAPLDVVVVVAMVGHLAVVVEAQHRHAGEGEFLALLPPAAPPFDRGAVA